MAEEPTQETAEEAIEIMRDPLSDSLPTVADWIPEVALPWWELISSVPLLGALIVAVLFFVLAILARFVFFQVLSRITGLTNTVRDDLAIHDLKKPIFVTVFYVGLALAVRVAEIPVGTEIAVNLLLSGIVVSWMRALLKLSSTLLEGMEENENFTLVEPRTIPLFDLSIKLGTILVGSYVLLLIWGIDPIGWLASAGIVGIAFGFAAKDTLANLFSGFFIIADAPYKIGDYITLDSGERGMVSAIGLRSTRLLTRDDVEVTIPNGVIANAKIVNESGGPDQKIRTRVRVGVAYGSDLDQVSRVLTEVAVQHAETCEEPAPRVRARAFGASSVDFDLLAWIHDPQDRGRITHELLVEVYRALGREGIEIPYTKQDVYIKEMPSKEAESTPS